MSTGFQPSQIAAAFVAARRAKASMTDYPGIEPQTLDEGYAVQDAALALWPEAPAGWKLGRIPPAVQDRFPVDRLAGPIFPGAVWAYEAAAAPFVIPAFAGGTACVEGEFVFRTVKDADPAKVDWTLDEAADLVGPLHIGVEPAGSPLRGINGFGPVVVASDFGNNAGLLIGPEVEGWRDLDWAELSVATLIDGAPVGTGTGASIPGTPLAAVAFLAGHLAQRGIALPAGTWISTGAVTGVHDIEIGQSAHVDFGRLGAFDVRFEAATRD